MSAPVPEVAASGTFIVRDGRIVYASAGALAVAGRPAEQIIGRGFPELVVPEQRELLVDRHARRLRGEPVPAEYEASLLLPDGTRRVVECRVALDGTDVLLQVQDVTAQAERRPRLAELARLGAEIQRERTEDAVFERVREGLWGLGLSAFLLRAEDDGVRIVWARVPSELGAAFEVRLGRPIVGYLGPWTPFSRTAWTDGVAFTDDWVLHASGFIPPDHAEAARALAASLRLSRAVAVRVDERAAARYYLVIVGEWMRSADAPAFRLFGAQVAAALDAARTIAELSRHNADLAALNRIGELVGGSAELGEFFRRAAEVVLRTASCDALSVFRARDGDGLERVYDTLEAPRADEPLLSMDSPAGEVVRTRVPRMYRVDGHDPASRAFLAEAGLSTVAWVPLVARSKVLGVMGVAYRRPLEAAAEARLDLLGAVAAHFAAAIESRALLEDLRRRVSELTLLNEVAMASTTLDPVVLLDSAVRRVAETLGCEAGAAYLRDGERLVLVASAGLSPESAHAALHLDVGEGLPGRAVAGLGPVLGVEGGATDRFAAVPAREGLGALAAVPLLSKNQALGALVMGRRPAAPFGPGDVQLLSAIGVQLGVAAENARLFADTRRRLGDLEAVHALAQRIFGNAPGDVRALLEDGCRDAARALAVRSAALYLLDDSGRTLRSAAIHGTPISAEPIVVHVESDLMAEEALRSGAPVWSEDVSRDPRSSLRGRSIPPLAVLAVPLTSRASTRGILFLGDDAGRRFTEAERALALALGAELAMGLENAELYAQARRRVEELGLLHEVGRSLVATLELPDVLEAGVRNLARIVDAPEAYLALATEDGRRLELRAVAGPRSDLLGGEIPVHPPEGTLVSLVFDRREPIVIPDAATDPRVPPDLRAGGKAYLGLPLLVRDRNIGSALIVETRGPRAFSPAEVQRAAAIANQLAVAVENARLYEDLRRSYAELRLAQQQNIHRERLAALGELSAVVAHEVRNPLGVIFNSLGSLRRLVNATGDAKMLLDIVQEEADRLNRIVGDLLDFARPAEPQVRPERIERVLEDAVGAALASSPAVALEQVVAPDLPAVPIDARMVRQAVLNVAMNAIQAMPRGGKLAVRATHADGAVQVEIEDSGAGMPEEVLQRIFQPFFTTKATGTGLGLAVVKRIVDGHGGEVRVESRPGAGTRFRLRFPLSHPGAPPTT